MSAGCMPPPGGFAIAAGGAAPPAAPPPPHPPPSPPGGAPPAPGVTTAAATTAAAVGPRCGVDVGGPEVGVVAEGDRRAGGMLAAALGRQVPSADVPDPDPLAIDVD